ncbi:MAG: hypothetical protein QS2022_3830 [Candidatus Phytoplasma asteris]|uniref:Integrase n=1 Tax='Chrysanthemum coronarium' phytoplasma TaxID=1520703 RepID=A0ABQ0J358_9MOLU|nr:MAG: hypothetical protein PLY_3810 [Periwinkle leaf yellowing phytoplasma]WEX19633.1 MAG: hypothetical protein QS2022_3830 [Candidatus Phytoplasma asteris]GAK74030.1 integrase ['Chrysanthemum coronarium' phytoplasma]
MLNNQDFMNIKQFNTNIQTVDILKGFFKKTTFNLSVDKYMKTNHQQLNHYFNQNNIQSQSQKVICGKINEYLILLYFQNKGIANLCPQVNLFFIPDINILLEFFVWLVDRTGKIQDDKKPFDLKLTKSYRRNEV